MDVSRNQSQHGVAAGKARPTRVIHVIIGESDPHSGPYRTDFAQDKHSCEGD